MLDLPILQPVLWNTTDLLLPDYSGNWTLPMCQLHFTPNICCSSSCQLMCLVVTYKLTGGTTLNIWKCGIPEAALVQHKGSEKGKYTVCSFLALTLCICDPVGSRRTNLILANTFLEFNLYLKMKYLTLIQHQFINLWPMAQSYNLYLLE